MGITKSYQRRTAALMRGALTIMALIVGLAGCSQDSLTLQHSEIVITVHESDAYQSADAETLTIHLGEVPVYGAKTATFLVSNPSITTLRVEDISYDQQEGVLWQTPTWRKDAADPEAKVAPLVVPGHEAYLMDITFSPIQMGEASAKILLSHDAGGAPKEVTVLATAVYIGNPEIEVAYNGLLVPSAADCNEGVCAVNADSGLNLGNIALETKGTAQLTVKNIAECDPEPSGNPCSTCVLRLAPDADHHGLGIGFKEGTNEGGLFTIETAPTLPNEIPQKDAECGNTGETKILVGFAAPAEESAHETVLVIENNDSDEGVIEIPITAQALNAPIAVATLRAFTADNPSAPYTDPEEIEPLYRVYLDGRQSYDPSVPAPDNTNLPYYHWEVVNAPQEFAEVEYQWEGQNQFLSSFWVPIAGEYTVKLTVQNEHGIQSGDTESAFVTFTAVPGSAIHIQLVWDHPTNDQDLHLVWGANGDAYENVCHKQYDCYFANCKATTFGQRVHWFQEAEAGAGPNPRLDRDDTNGLGPENINIDEPSPGNYRVYAHYWGGGYNGAPATVNTVRIYLNGLLRFDQHRTLTAVSQIWGIGTINWVDDDTDLGTGSVEVFQGEPGQVGAVSTLTTMNCSGSSGWAFPHPAAP